MDCGSIGGSEPVNRIAGGSLALGGWMDAPDNKNKNQNKE